MTTQPTHTRVVLFPEDVARIWTEEAHAEAARLLVRALKRRAQFALDQLPDVSRRTPPSRVDLAVTAVREELTDLLDISVPVEMLEREVHAIIGDIDKRLRKLHRRFGRLPADDVNVMATTGHLDALTSVIEKERSKPERVVPVSTVYSYVTKSRPTGPGVEPARYASNPVPEAKARRGARQPIWLAEQEPELRAWWRSRPGRGAGGGRPRKTAVQASR